MVWPQHDMSLRWTCQNLPPCSSGLHCHNYQSKKASYKLQGIVEGLVFFRKKSLKWEAGMIQEDEGRYLGWRRILSIIICRQDLTASILQCVDILNGLFLDAIFAEFLPHFFPEGINILQLIIWDLAYTKGNFDTKKLDLGHVIKILCVIISDIVKYAPEILPATTIGMFSHFFVLPIFFQKGGMTLSLMLGVVRSSTLLVASEVGGDGRGKFDMNSIATIRMHAHQQQKTGRGLSSSSTK